MIAASDFYQMHVGVNFVIQSLLCYFLVMHVSLGKDKFTHKRKGFSFLFHVTMLCVTDIIIHDGFI